MSVFSLHVCINVATASPNTSVRGLVRWMKCGGESEGEGGKGASEDGENGDAVAFLVALNRASMDMDISRGDEVRIDLLLMSMPSFYNATQGMLRTLQ